MVTHQLTAQTAHVHSTGGACVCVCVCVCVCTCTSTNATDECRFESGAMVKDRDEIEVVK